MEEKKMGRQLFFAAAIILYGIFLGMPVWGQSRLQRGIAREVLRFHVLADSDSTEDQVLKMQVKDVLVEKLNGLLQDCENAAESEKAVQENLGQIETWAAEEIQRRGFSCPVSAALENVWFPEKSYGDCTFPEGEYRAPQVKIAEAKGQNWWCLLFPGLCFAGTVEGEVPPPQKEKLRQVLTQEEYEAVTGKENLHFGFKWF